MSCNNFCKAVVRVGKETAVVINQKCKGWYTASKSILAPAIQEKNRLRHCLHNRSSLSTDKVVSLQAQLKAINKRNQGLVELAKASWYKGICNKIHKMSMDPCLAWENILTYSPEVRRHTTRHLESGELQPMQRKTCQCLGRILQKC